MDLFASLMTTKMLGNFFDRVLAYAAGGSAVLSSDIQPQLLFHWLDCDKVEEGTSADELSGDFSREPTKIAESVSSALSLSVLFQGIPSRKLQRVAEKMRGKKKKSVALFSLIDLRSSDADSDKHIPCLASRGPTLKMKQWPSQNSFPF